MKFRETESFETSRVVDLPDGPVTIFEGEVHGFYEAEPAASTRLIISDAIDMPRNFISKARAEFADLNCLMRELTAR